MQWARLQNFLHFENLSYCALCNTNKTALRNSLHHFVHSTLITLCTVLTIWTGHICAIHCKKLSVQYKPDPAAPFPASLIVWKDYIAAPDPEYSEELMITTCRWPWWLKDVVRKKHLTIYTIFCCCNFVLLIVVLSVIDVWSNWYEHCSNWYLIQTFLLGSTQLIVWFIVREIKVYLVLNFVWQNQSRSR